MVDRDPSIGASMRRRERIRSVLSELAAGLMILPIPSSSTTDIASGYRPYDAPKAPVTTANPFDNYPTPIVSATPSETKPQIDTCIEGVPVEFHSPDMGIYHAPIEQVGVDDKGTPDIEDDDSIAAPEGRGEDGGYNTVGWYKFGPKPGAEEGVPVFSAHSTRVEKSLLPREAFTEVVLGKVASGKSIAITVILDNGGVCNYVVPPSGVHLVEDKDENYSRVIGPIVNGGRNDEIVFNTCAGEPNLQTRTSNDAVILNGEKTI